MSPPDLLPLRSWIVAIDLVGGLMIAGYAAGALAALPRRGVAAARLLVCDGAVAALSFKAAGSLLKAIELKSWQQILAFAAVLALRTLLKRLFAWEEGRLLAARPGA